MLSGPLARTPKPRSDMRPKLEVVSRSAFYCSLRCRCLNDNVEIGSDVGVLWVLIECWILWK